MSKNYVEEEVFERVDFSKEALPKGDYTQCRFVQCNFAKADLSSIAFVECVFEGCDLSLARIFKTAFREVSFTDCKLLGLSFDQANSFLFSIEPVGCNMASCSFQGMRLEKLRFQTCSLQGADFTGADLRASVFTECDLLNATFDNTDLQGADLRGATTYIIDPGSNRLKGARFTLSEVGGLLARYGVILEP
jgi:fluoroquinolone resistance protein